MSKQPDVSEVNLKEFPYTMTYTQQKTGTTSVMRAVASTGVPCHRCYAGNVSQYHLTDMPTITMVREPVERAVSQLWEESGETIPAMSSGNHNENLRRLIIQSLGWFGLHYRPVTGINVYGTQFVRSKGYIILSIRGLIMRTDRLSDVLEPALKEFLPPYFPNADFSNLDTSHRAKGDERFGDEYAEFMETVKFPRKFLEEIYDSQFVRHFFTVNEIKAFIQRWKE